MALAPCLSLTMKFILFLEQAFSEAHAAQAPEQCVVAKIKGVGLGSRPNERIFRKYR